jgi:hypothetical protein
VPIPKASEYANLCGKRDFSDVIELGILKLKDYPAFSRWYQFNHSVLIRDSRKIRVRGRRDNDGSKDQKGPMLWNPESNNKDSLGMALGSWNRQATEAPLEPPEGNSPVTA